MRLISTGQSEEVADHASNQQHCCNKQCNEQNLDEATLNMIFAQLEFAGNQFNYGLDKRFIVSS